MSNSLFGPLDDVAGDAGHVDHPPRMGFFTDTSICIGCKACEVACKQWNGVPAGDELDLLGMSHDNTGELGANSWRHVAFIEQAPTSPVDPPANLGMPGMQPPGAATGAETRTDFRWLMASDVCKHCTHAGCLDVCPTGALFRTEFGTVVVQQDICNGCGYCVSGCPYGVIEQDEHSKVAQKCTLCYDRLQGGMEPACAKACPTQSIQFGPLDELRGKAQQRVDALHSTGVSEARLYGASDDDVYGGLNAFFLLMDEPEAYNLPNKENAVLPSRNNERGYLTTLVTAVAAVVGGLIALRRRREPPPAPEPAAPPPSPKPDEAEVAA